MKKRLAPLAPVGLLALVGFLPPAVLGAVTYAVVENVTQDQAPAAQPAAAAEALWEYEVVGLTEIYGSTLDYLKGALDGDKKDLLKLAKRTDDQLVAKTRDLLNEYGKQGWELVEYRENVLVFKRPAR